MFIYIINLYYLLKLMSSEHVSISYAFHLRVAFLFFVSFLPLCIFSDCARAVHFSADLQNGKSNAQSGDLNPQVTGRKPANRPYGILPTASLECNGANLYYNFRPPVIHITSQFTFFSPKFHLSSLILSFTFLRHRTSH